MDEYLSDDFSDFEIISTDDYEPLGAGEEEPDIFVEVLLQI
jgi:hypothetical protein